MLVVAIIFPGRMVATFNLRSVQDDPAVYGSKSVRSKLRLLADGASCTAALVDKALETRIMTAWPSPKRSQSKTSRGAAHDAPQTNIVADELANDDSLALIVDQKDRAREAPNFGNCSSSERTVSDE
jgi:hypothetical protein